MEVTMLAEIYLVRLEMQLHIAATAAAANKFTTSSDRRFVPVTLPRETPSKPN